MTWDEFFCFFAFDPSEGRLATRVGEGQGRGRGRPGRSRNFEKTKGE